MKPAPLLVLLAALGPLARADDQTYDLRAILARKPRVGTKVLQRERESHVQLVEVLSRGEVAQTKREARGYAEERLTEVLELDAQGAPRKLRHTYKRFRDLARDKDLEVAGLEVTVTLGERAPTLEVAGRKPLPKPLRKRLLAEHSGSESRVLLPDKPVAAGGTWAIAPRAFAKETGFGREALDAKASSAEGKLLAVEERGGQPWVRFQVKVKLVFRAVQGMQAKVPFVVETTLTADLPADPALPGGKLERSFKSDGLLLPPDGAKGVLIRLRQEGSGASSSAVAE